MGGSAVAVKVAAACVVVVICMVVTAPGRVEAAISCGTVVSKLTPCISYLRAGGTVPDLCCTGIRSLKSLAATTADRQAACTCLKNLSGSYKGVDLGRASGLPGKCGVSIPYKISPSVDCSKVT